jgi:hypothetical protein
VRDIAEAGGNVLAGAGAFAFGAATAVSDILNTQLARVARGGPMAGGPESKTHYRDIFNRMDQRITSLTPEPRSDIAKNVNKAVGTVTGLIKDVAELPGRALVATGVLNEDTARVLSFATELYLFYKLDQGVRKAAPEIRSKIAEYKTRMSRATTDAQAAAAAEDLANAASKNPRLNNALEEARGKFRDEADREVGMPPRGPKPPDEGPAGGGAAADIVYDPAELRAYKSELDRVTDEWAADPNRGSIMTDLRERLGRVPKPQGTPRAPAEPTRPTPTPEAARPAAPTPEAPRSAEPQAQRAPEPQRAAPTMTAERPVQPEVVVRGETALAPVTPEAPRPTREIAPIETPRVEAAATVAPETVPAPVSPETPAVAAVSPTAPEVITPTRTEYRGPAFAAIEAIQNEETSPADRKTSLANLKREALNTDAKSVERGLRQLGVDEETIQELIPQLKKVRAAKSERGIVESSLSELSEMPVSDVSGAVRDFLSREGGATIQAIVNRVGFARSEVNEAIQNLLNEGSITQVKQGNYTRYYTVNKPAVQQAATEAVLENAPAGTEVEIPAPAEPVIDTSPVIEKPKRKRKVVKAPDTEPLINRPTRRPIYETSTPESRAAAEQSVFEERAVRKNVESFKEEIQETLQQIGMNLADVMDAFSKGVRPSQLRQTLISMGLPEDVARRTADTAYYAYTRPVVTNVGFTEIKSVTNLEPSAKASILPFKYTELISSAPIQVRTIEGRPDAIFVDTRGMNARTSLANIELEIQRGRTSPELGQVLKRSLQAQADFTGLPIERAHEFTGQELIREATRVAAENDLDLYVMKGRNYELVPKDVVRTDARLNSGDDLRAVPISKDAAGAYVESKTSPIGPEQIEEMLRAIEQGVDITDKLPADLIPHYKAMRESARAGIDTSERRAFIDILNDVNTMLGEEGAIGGNWSREARMAAQRLQADMRKAGKNVREFLFGARPEDVAMFERYLEGINNPEPPNSTNPRNMRFDPENVIPGDRVVKQRVASGNTYVPLWQSEVRGIQNARDIKPGGGEWNLKLPLRQHKAAGTEFLYYAYRTAQKNLNAELNTLHADMEELGRGFSSKSLENIGANGYARQGGDGQRILTYNKVTPQPLTSAERRLQANLDGVYAYLYNRVNEVRAATGREPLARVDDYQTFARTINVLNALGIKVDLARDTSDSVHAKYIKHRATNFPYIVRKHAFYTAEMNALKILDTYAQSALKDIHMSPFIAKMHELIETNLPDPVTGKETWQLKDNKPGLYEELRNWTDYIATGTNKQFTATQRMILNTVNKNVAYATLSGLIRSGTIQLSTLVNTSQTLGIPKTLGSAFEMLADLPLGKKKDFALRNSEILSSRKFIDAYNEVTSAFVGRRPGELFRALGRGNLAELQQMVGRPGFKLIELLDMEAALVTWNAGYKFATSPKVGYNHKDAVRYADDLVVRTQGSTMPGDLAGIQRNPLGKLVTQFQTFLISDFNFLRDEVLTKGKIGGGGGGQIPPGGVASGPGSWEEPGAPRSNMRFMRNVIGFLIITQIINELYKLLHIQPALPDPVEDVRKGMQARHSLPQLALDLAVGQIERLPIIGGMRYGKGIAGPAIETARDAARAYRNDPLSPPWWEPTATLLGVPGTRQISKFTRAQKRGENVYDSLMGWYSQEPTRGARRERSERRERR